MAIEKPTYSVIKHDGPFEIRRYDPYITSQVTIQANNAREAASIGFSPLGNYIFGGNTSRQKIAMTAPVAVSGQGTYTVSFMIPSKYTLASLPIPDDERVQFIHHPAQTFAAIRFSGPFQQPNFDKHILKLRTWMIANNLVPVGEPVIRAITRPSHPTFSSIMRS